MFYKRLSVYKFCCSFDRSLPILDFKLELPLNSHLLPFEEFSGYLFIYSCSWHGEKKRAQEAIVGLIIISLAEGEILCTD